MNATIKLLIMILVVAAVGKFTQDLVTDDLRRRRRRSEAQTEEMTVYAIRCNGKLGIIKGLV